MRTFTSRQRRAAVALAVLALLFATFDVVGAPFAGARTGVQGFFGGLYRGTDSVLGPARGWVAELPHLGSDRATIAAQGAQIAAQQRDHTTTGQNTATAVEVTRLQLQADRGGYRVLPAHVIAVGPAGSFDWTVVLDAGSHDGVRVGQSVIDGPNLVGRIVRVSASSATVLLAADPDSGVGVRDQRSKQVGIAAGRGLAGYAFTALNPTAAPKAGDLLVTGPAGKTTYVAGLILGTVTGVHIQLDGTVQATVRAPVSPTTLDLVGVVLVGGTSVPRPALTPAGSPSVGAQAHGTTRPR